MDYHNLDARKKSVTSPSSIIYFNPATRETVENAGVFPEELKKVIWITGDITFRSGVSMTFSSGIFLIGSLPWFVILYRLLSDKKLIWREVLIILANSLFIIWGGVASFLMIVAFAIMVCLFSELNFRYKSKAVLTVSLVLTIIPLAIIKYTLFAIGTINSVLGSDIGTPSIIVPMGISFITFEAISLLVDVYKGKIDENPNIVTVFLYLSFFPTVTSGPLIRYNEFLAGIKTASFSNEVIAIERIVIGLSKKVLVADKIAVLADYYFDGIAKGNNYSCIGLWIGSLAYTLQLYFDFSGYSDMAIGIGQLLGFDIRNNFNKPYQASSISDFWKRWHISLTQWFRDYVYIPLGGNRCSMPRHIFNMFVVWLLTGLWHGADWTFILWGLGYFVLLVAEKNIPIMRKIGSSVIGHVYTMFFVNLLWVPFRAKNLAVAVQYLRGMFGNGSGLIEEKAIRFIPFMLIVIVLCLPWNKCLSAFSERATFSIIRKIVIVIISGLAICAAINSSYMPYIYGNF